jgi:two-component system, sensor histidine kinase and response regulator
MGGEISVTSEPAEGSTFSFTIKTKRGYKVLPAYAVHNMDEHKGKKVLLIDDNVTNLAILKRQMENWELLPVLAGSGQEALEIIFQDHGIDLVVTDMQMPEMDGATLATHVQRYMPQIPIILLSSIGEELREQHRQLFASVLIKPIRQHILGNHIANALHGKIGFSNDAERSNKLSTEFSQRYPLELLVAEDNQINRHVIIRILQKLGYEPDVAEDGQEALEAANLKSYGIILMDMQMPVMDGLEATRVIRKTVVAQPVIIALTANVMEGIEEECIEAGMDDYLGKPIKLEELMAKIRKWHKKSKTISKAK